MNNLLTQRHPDEIHNEPQPPQTAISTSQPIDPSEPTLTAAEITRSMRITMKYEEIIRILESDGFTITEKTTETCRLTNKQETVRVYCVQDKISHIATAVEMELIAEPGSQQLFSAEITKLFKKHNFPIEDI